MNVKQVVPLIGLGVAAGAALGMAVKPRDQAMIKNKAGQAVKTVGEAMENLSNTIRTQ